jgi:hypothetical protein
MKISLVSFFFGVTILVTCCDEVDNFLNDTEDGKITAKEKLDEVINAARSDFSADAMLAAIYGREVDVNGEIDLLKADSFNAFVYTMQSDVLQTNEFYVLVLVPARLNHQ